MWRMRKGKMKVRGPSEELSQPRATPSRKPRGPVSPCRLAHLTHSFCHLPTVMSSRPSHFSGLFHDAMGDLPSLLLSTALGTGSLLPVPQSSERVCLDRSTAPRLIPSWDYGGRLVSWLEHGLGDAASPKSHHTLKGHLH